MEGSSVNTEAVLELAEFIEGLEHLNRSAVEDIAQRTYSEVPPGRWFRLDIWMASTKYQFDCGTVGCISGWAVWHWNLQLFTASREVGRLLGLTDVQSKALFTPSRTYGVGYRHVTPVMAGAVLRHLAETGQVDWSIIASGRRSQYGE